MSSPSEVLEPMPGSHDAIPERCQQFGCRRPVETWCPLCRAFFCDEHDQLTPVRRHDCLRGKAEA